MDISNTAIGSLQSPDRLDLLNDIDRFRQDGLHNLPQIVVCGDTSSGKSSVLGALSGIQFPVSGTVCTRFATEIALRYSAAEKITGHAFITTAAKSSGSHRMKVKSFRRDITNLDCIPSLMDDARKQMGLAETSGFSRDVLHLKLEGKQLPNLTLVDLPGLIHASWDQNDIGKVKSLVEDYFKQKESIILIVVSAENVIQNQGILTMSRDFDPKGTRSIGVITKPDVLERPDKAGSKPEIIKLARNQNTSYQFKLGWHVVRCLNDKERADGLDRELVENAMFGEQQWKDVLQPKQMGIQSLRSSLSKCLHQHILQLLPELQTSLENEIKETKSSLDLLGESRTTPQERILYLTRISKHYGKIVRDALEGNYSDVFFQDSDVVKKLRAKTMALTEKYEESMRTIGHSFSIYRERHQVKEGTPYSPEQITQSDALLKVGKLLKDHRGPELSFLFNPRLVGVLFTEQSKKWPLLTFEYTHQISHAVQEFLHKALDFLCPPTSEKPYLIYHHFLEEALQNNLESLESKTRELFSPYEAPFLFSTKRRLQTSLKRIEDEALQRENGDTVERGRQSSAPETMGSDYDIRFKLLQYSEAYYDVAIETFIDNVVVLGVEACLLSKLEAMFTFETVMQMDEATRNLVGGESADMQNEREMLNTRLATLDKALKRCRMHTSRHNWYPAGDATYILQTVSAASAVAGVDESHKETNGRLEKEEERGVPEFGASRKKPCLDGEAAEASSRPPSQSSNQFAFLWDPQKYPLSVNPAEKTELLPSGKTNGKSRRARSVGDFAVSAATVAPTTPRLNPFSPAKNVTLGATEAPSAALNSSGLSPPREAASTRAASHSPFASSSERNATGWPSPVAVAPPSLSVELFAKDPKNSQGGNVSLEVPKTRNGA